MSVRVFVGDQPIDLPLDAAAPTVEEIGLALDTYLARNPIKPTLGPIAPRPGPIEPRPAPITPRPSPLVPSTRGHLIPLRAAINNGQVILTPWR